MMKAAIRVLAGAVLASFASLAAAHAFLDHAAPAVGSEVHGSPAEVKVWFSQDLEPAFSSVSVTDEQNGQVDRKDKRVEGSVLRVSLPPLPAGTYRVHWRVLSVDTHVTQGDFTFKVVP
jgi:copper resistance protein C